MPSAFHINNQKGLAPVVMIVIAAVVLAVVGGGYYLSTQSKSGSNPLAGIASKVASLNPNCEYKDPDLCKFLNNFRELKNYSAKSTFSSTGAPKSETLVEAAGDDKTHMVTSENGKESFNVITIGNTTYY